MGRLRYIKNMPAQKINKTESATKPFLKVQCTAFTTMERVVQEKLLNELKYFTKLNLTGATLEVYHSLYNKYCPKCLHFSYERMIARSVLDLNADLGVNADLDLSLRPRLNSENLDLSSSFQKLPNCALQKISYQTKTKSILTIW